MPLSGGGSSDLVSRSRRLAELAGRRLTLGARAVSARARALQLRDHLDGFVTPRAADIEAPLLVVLIGPTGAGKSSILNAIANAAVSRTGALRPTTRAAVLYAEPDDARRLRSEGRMHQIPDGRLVWAAAPPGNAGVAIVDAPDIDSVERDNRALANTLLESCDLCVFVTTATRYADLVPWHVLQRIKQREVPLIVVLNRLPPDAGDRALVVADTERLLAEHGLGEAGGSVEVIAIGEGD